jgi:hypothetical protein
MPTTNKVSYESMLFSNWAVYHFCCFLDFIVIICTESAVTLQAFEALLYKAASFQIAICNFHCLNEPNLGAIVSHLSVILCYRVHLGTRLIRHLLLICTKYFFAYPIDEYFSIILLL